MPEREPMSAVDAAWFQMDEPGNAADITVLFEFDGPLDYDRLLQTVDARLISRYPRFRRRVVSGELGRRYWEEDPAFDLRRQIHTATLQNGSEEELRELASELTTRPLPEDRPLWQMHLVEGCDDGGALIIRIHHCVGDGFGLAAAMLRLADHEREAPIAGDENLAPTRTASEPGHDPLRDRIVHEAHLVREDPRHATELAKFAADFATTLGEMILLPFDHPTRLKNKLSGTRRLAWSKPIPLDEVKRIGRSIGATVNDTLMSAMTGALRQWLLEHDEPVDDFDLRAMVPINLRPIHSIEEMDDDLGNRFGLVILDLPVSHSDVRSRLETLKRNMDALKESPMAFVALGILNVVGKTPAVIEHIVTNIFARKTSLVCTNVPGPSDTLYLAGKELTDVVFWVPHPAKLGLGVSILSYAGDIRVSVRTDVAVIDDPTEFVRMFEDELSALAAGG
jgi:WS/DGAT/MGAT family acyltransferase